MRSDRDIAAEALRRAEIIKYPPQITERRFDKDPANCRTLNDCLYIEKTYETISEFIDYIINDHNSLQAASIQKRQLEIFGSINKNADGTAGEKIMAYCIDHNRRIARSELRNKTEVSV